MTERDALERIEKWVKLMFPKDSGHPAWTQEPYRGMLFRIFADTYHEMKLYGDRITEYFDDTWRSTHSEEEWSRLRNIFDDWDEWIYAWDKYPTRTS